MHVYSNIVVLSVNRKVIKDRLANNMLGKSVCPYICVLGNLENRCGRPERDFWLWFPSRNVHFALF